MSKPGFLAAAALLAFSASTASAQVDTRDHRKNKKEVRDHRKPAAPAPQVMSLTPDIGHGGTQVTIRGRQLGKVTKVVFGKREIAPDKVGPREIVFTVPEVKKPGPRAIVLRHPLGDLPAGTFKARRGERVVATPGDPAVAPPVEPPAVEPPAVAPPVGDRPGRRPGRAGRRLHRERMTVAGFAPNAGKPGTKVIINGTNFTPETKILYHGQEIAPTKVTPRRLVFKVPKGEGDGMIKLKGPKGKRTIVVGKFDVTRKFDMDARKKRRDDMRTKAEQRWAKRRGELAKDKAERRKAMLAQEAEMAETRAERRAKRAAALRNKWKREFLVDENTQAEVSMHAERMARLARMRRLAETDDLGKLVVRIDIAIERENGRHDRRMELLKANFAAEGGAQ